MTSLSSLEKYAGSLGAQVLYDEPMSKHTTFRIGGPARLFITPADAGSVEKISDYSVSNEIPLLIVGNGSNLLVPDEGIPGAVLHLGKGTDAITVDPESCEVTCGAGAQLELACICARRHALTGLEFAYGIPGTVGGAVYMNAGAYGGEIRNALKDAHHIGHDGPGSVDGSDSAFGYRRSPYTDAERIITKAVFKLAPGNPEEIAARMNELMERRRSKQPLEYPSAGSVFKRPTGYYAGTLIEQCGLKGVRVGGAMVSKKHAGFIVNAGGATCRDVLTLIEKIKDEVFRQTGVVLESEIKVIGRP